MKKTSRYDLSKIMTYAWKRYRMGREYAIAHYSKPSSFGFYLKMAWAHAKEEVALAEAAQNGVDFEQDMTVDLIGMHTVTLNRWSKYGKDRVYFNGGCSGYYDIIKGVCVGKRVDRRLEQFMKCVRFPAI